MVGDSLGMVVLGYENTIPVTMDDMIHHTKPVVRAAKRALVIGDMPYFSFHLAIDDSVFNASRFIKEAGAQGVKIEGASKKRLKLIESLVDAEIPVMGHVGLTPQSIHHIGQFKVKGAEKEEAKKVIQEAADLEKAGVFAVILECIPMEVAGIITERLRVPTIGIGAGPWCDGQIWFFMTWSAIRRAIFRNSSRNTRTSMRSSVMPLGNTKKTFKAGFFRTMSIPTTSSRGWHGF